MSNSRSKKKYIGILCLICMFLFVVFAFLSGLNYCYIPISIFMIGMFFLLLSIHELINDTELELNDYKKNENYNGNKIVFPSEKTKLVYKLFPIIFLAILFLLYSIICLGIQILYKTSEFDNIIEMSFLIPAIIDITLLLIFLVIIFPGVVITKKILKRVFCTQEIQAIIKKYPKREVYYRDNGHTRIDYIYLYQCNYTFEGIIYKYEIEKRSGKKIYNSTKNVKIRINPNKPTQFYVLNKKFKI